jgi:hypothetical protein
MPRSNAALQRVSDRLRFTLNTNLDRAALEPAESASGLAPRKRMVRGRAPARFRSSVPAASDEWLPVRLESRTVEVRAKFLKLWPTRTKREPRAPIPRLGAEYQAMLDADPKLTRAEIARRRGSHAPR